jgi:hypothetical protein
MKLPDRAPIVAFALFATLALSAGSARAQKPDFLTDEEQDKLRDAQDPAKRIELYLAFSQARLERFQNFISTPADPSYDNGAYLDALLGEVIDVNDELKNWIDTQYERKGDMRGGLRKLLSLTPREIEDLRRIDKTPGPYGSAFQHTLREAIDDLSDTLDGATKALAEQDKVFAEEKREEKASARDIKERRKEEEKRTKEEQKLRKREHQKGVPAESDTN